MTSISANLGSVFERLTRIDAFRIQPTTPGDTTTTAALARLAVTIPVTAITNFATTEPFFIIGDGGTELNHVNGAPAGSAIVPKYPIALAQASGARVVEGLMYPLGHISEGSSRVGGSGSTTPIPAATSQVPVGYMNTGGALTFGLSLLDFSVRSLALAYGQDELETGAGTASDPYTIVASGTTIGTHGLLCLRAQGVRNDGAILMVDMLDCTITPNPDINVSGKTPNFIPVAGNCVTHIFRVVSA